MQQKIVIKNKHGEKLVGLLHETGSNEVVVLCHGFTCSKSEPIIVNLAVALEDAGISAFRFVFNGNGESEGSFQFGNYYRGREDILAVIEYFGRENRKIIALVGHSNGGNSVLLYASKYHDIGAVVNISGRYDMQIKEALKSGLVLLSWKGSRRMNLLILQIEKLTIGKVYRATKESVMERRNINMHEACLSIDGRCRVLTVHGSTDKTVQSDDAMEFEKVIPNHNLHIVEGADHGYNKHQNELASAVVSYIKDCL